MFVCVCVCGGHKAGRRRASAPNAPAMRTPLIGLCNMYVLITKLHVSTSVLDMVKKAKLVSL